MSAGSKVRPQTAAPTMKLASGGKRNMRNFARKKLTIGAFMATSALGAISSPAYAQYAPPVDVPPVHSKSDEFNVDLVTRYVAAETSGSISIGPSGPGGLNYIWTNSNRAGTDLNSGMTISGSTYSVYIAGATTSFTLSGTLGSGTFTNNQANGASLTYSSATGQYTFTSSGGTVFVLGISGLPWPVSLTHPAGESLTWNYDTSGSVPLLRSVTTNLGYQYRPTYTGTYPHNYITKAVLFNMANESCDPLAVSCTLTNSWPTIDFTAGTVNGNPAIRWAFQRNADNTITETETIPITSTQNETLTYQEDSSGRVNSVTDGNGVWTYSYPGPYGGDTTKSAGNGSASDPSRVVRVVAWDTSTGLITSDTLVGSHDGSGNGNDTINYNYDAYGRTSTLTHNGVKTAYTYDGNGNVTQTITTTDTNNANPITTSAVYPSSGCNTKTCNQPSSTTDANGNVTTYTYDPNSGGVASVTRPAAPNGIRPQTRSTYTLTNGIYLLTATSACQTTASCAGTADEVKTTISYDAHANPTTVSSGSGNGALLATTTMTYTPNGDVATVDGPLSGTADTTAFYYDNDRRLIGTIGPTPGNGQPMRAMKVSYASGGGIDTSSLGTASTQSNSALSSMTVLQKAQMFYNAQGLKTQDTLFDNAGATAGVTQYSYTPERTLQCTAIRNNSGTWTSQSNACSQTSTNSDLITKTTYDDVGHLLTVRDGYTSDTQVPDLTNTWLPSGMLGTQADGNGNATTYTYDTFNRPIKINYPDGTTNQVTAYDNNGNVLTSVSRAGQTVSFSYDALDRVISKSGAVPTVNYGYDNLGRMLSAIFASNGLGVTNTYDALGHITSSSSNVDGTARQFSYQYDLAGRGTQMTYPDGYYLNYDYLTTGEVSKIRANGATSGINVLATYAYDPLGNRASLTLGNGVATNYAYDSLYRLHTLTHDLAGTTYDLARTLAYNPASQLTSATSSNTNYAFTNNYNVNRGYTLNTLNQYASVAGATFGYDPNGNLTSDGTNTFSYDAENHLTSATVAGAAATLSYDPLGQLWHVVKGGTDLRFYYAGPDMVAQYDSSGTLQYRYVFGPGNENPLLQYNPAGVRTWYTSDERGSIISDSDDSGTVGVINTYDEYGIPGSGNSGRFQYTGQMWVSELGMYFYKARAYSPTLGRFMQTDPIGYGDGMNWYAYTHNDPINATDPTGLGAGDSSCSDTDCTEIVVIGSLAVLGGFSGTGFEGGRTLGGLPSFIPTIKVPNFSTVICAQGLKEAKKDMAGVNRAKASWGTLKQRSAQAGIPPSLLAAVGMNETDFGAPQFMTEGGTVQGRGRGRGVFQITNGGSTGNNVPNTCAYNLSCAAQWAAGELASNAKQVSARYPALTPDEVLQASADLYNMGPGKHWKNMSGNPATLDVGTKGADPNHYGQAAMDMAACFEGM